MPGYARQPSYFARNISLTPAGNIEATNLQAGLEEIDSEKTTESYVNAEVASVPTGSKNLLYNGAMQVHQRGTSTTGITGSGYNTADRWQATLTSIGTWTQTVENDAPTGSGFRKSLKMLCTTADATPASTDALQVIQYLEGQDVQRIAKGTASAKQLTLSFWVKSSTIGTYAAELNDNDNARFLSLNYTISASATWEKKVITFPADTIGVLDNDNNLSLFVRFWLASGSAYTTGAQQSSWVVTASNLTSLAPSQINLAAATNNYWQVTGVQLEVGDTATEFEHLPYGVELARCQRYYETGWFWEEGTNAVSGGQFMVTQHFMTRKRANATITYGNVSGSNANINITGIEGGYDAAPGGGQNNLYDGFMMRAVPTNATSTLRQYWLANAEL